ncbi:MAG: GntG family PLP-dependent aldolase [Myxococcota bacterium]|nr:GntG family PLP-dependent aldolase [Myxococcota bacterium]
MPESATDLRSDTITVPSAAMRDAMLGAVVGDDVFNEDPTVHALQEHGAKLVGQQAALFVPSGTMANQLAILSHCRPGDDVLVGVGAHIMLYESGAAAAIGGVQFSVVDGNGHFEVDALLKNLKRTDAAGHIPPTTMVAVENTHNRGGGLVLSPQSFLSLAEAAHAHEIAVHMDGARLFNAAAAEGVGVDAWGRHCDTVSICLSKGLGAPVGSLLCGSHQTIRRAHRFRKMLGGGMRQAGIIAAAGLHALHYHVDGLRDDHRRARIFAEEVAKLSMVCLNPTTVRTNIVIFDTPSLEATDVCARLAPWVKVLPFGPRRVRAVFHRDVDDDGLERAITGARAVLA